MPKFVFYFFLVMAVDYDGCFTELITDFKGRHVKEADIDDDIIKFSKESIVDKYKRYQIVAKSKLFIYFCY